MKIQILGSGCQTCKKLHVITLRAVKELGIKSSVDYIAGTEGIQKIIELGVMTSPVMTVDNKIAMTGYIPDIEKIKEKIKALI